MADSFAVDLASAERPLVLSIDVGSTGTRGGVFDAAGRPVTKTRMRVDHEFRTGADGRSEIGPDLVVSGVKSVIDGVVAKLPAGSISAVCMDTFASSLVGVDDGAAVTPCFTYADSRPADQIAAMRGYISEGRLQQRTGTRLHPTYLPARLRWLALTDPDTFDLVDTWMSIGEYVYLRLLGVRGVAVSTAAWSGLLNRSDADWDRELLTALGLKADHLAEVRMPDQPFTLVSTKVAKRWPALRDAVWFPAVPDGYANHFGSTHADEETLMLSASTSGAIRLLVPGVPAQVPSGLWCHRVDRDRSLIGGALNDVGRLMDWLDSTLASPKKGDRDDHLAGPPRAASPVVLPFLTGERSVGWRGDARAVVSGLSAETDAGAIYRGAMEGVAMGYRRIVEQFAQVAPGITRIISSGGASGASPNWLPILAAVTGLPVSPLDMKRSTLRGNAVLALEQVAPFAKRALPELGPTIAPDPEWQEFYDRRYAEFLDLYERVYGV